MSTLEKLRSNNNKRIHSVEEHTFDKYGRILDVDIDAAIFDFMEGEADFPKAGNCYIASQKELEKYPLKQWVETNIYGQVESQIGYCNGHNSQVHGFEFHQCSEVFVAITDCILALTLPHRPLWKEAYQLDESDLFYIPKGRMIEIYPLVGHFSPIRVHEEGFRSIIILSKGTNAPILHEKEKCHEITEIDAKQKAFAVNKWLYVHEDRMDLVEKGAYLNVKGDNSPIKVL